MGRGVALPLLGAKSSSDSGCLEERQARGFAAFELHGRASDIATAEGLRQAAGRISSSGLACYAVHAPRYSPEDPAVELVVGALDRGWWPQAATGILRTAELAAACGAGIVVVHAGDCQPVPSLPAEEFRYAFAMQLEDLADALAREFPGIVLGVENVPPVAFFDGKRWERPLAYGDFSFTGWGVFPHRDNVGCVLDTTHALYAVEESRRQGCPTSFGRLVGRAAPSCVLVHLANPVGAYLEEVGTVPLHALPFTADCGLLRRVLDPLRGLAVPFTLEVTLDDHADSAEMASTRDAVAAAWQGGAGNCLSCLPAWER